MIPSLMMLHSLWFGLFDDCHRDFDVEDDSNGGGGNDRVDDEDQNDDEEEEDVVDEAGTRT